MRKRRAFFFVIVTLALALAGPSFAGGGSSTHGVPLEGTWMVDVVYHYPDSDAVLRYMQHFDRHGRATLIIPGESPLWEETRSGCLGEWKRRGRRTYDVTVYCLWSVVPGDPPAVPDRIRMKVSLDKGGQHWTATPFYYEVWTGTEYTSFTNWGEMEGARMGIAPLP